MTYRITAAEARVLREAVEQIGPGCHPDGLFMGWPIVRFEGPGRRQVCVTCGDGAHTTDSTCPAAVESRRWRAAKCTLAAAGIDLAATVEAQDAEIAELHAALRRVEGERERAVAAVRP